MQKPIVVKSKEISLLKPYTGANYDSKTVLTDSSWQYVELWFKRQSGENAKKALFYWQQAKHFFQASECLPENAKPLTSYYCCLNAVKALLCVNGIDVKNIHHGVHSNVNKTSSNSLISVEITFDNKGVLFEFAKYLGESVNKDKYTVKDLLYNIPCVHRTFCITYKELGELFIPISDLKFVREEKNNNAWLEFKLESKYSNQRVLNGLPNAFRRTWDKYGQENYCVRNEKNRIIWDKHTDIKKRLDDLYKYHGKLRKDIFYIYGDSKLWYIKKDLKSNKHIIKRSSMTLIFAVMHWLSELVRYNPENFEKYMNSKQNWLIHEFIQKALYQFIDEISCEITKEEIMVTGYRKN